VTDSDTEVTPIIHGVKSMLRTVDDHGTRYTCLMFVCPGCALEQTLPDGTPYKSTGLHMLPVNTTAKSPSWTWDGNLEAPTLSPSILTGRGSPNICHSFLRVGVFEYLGDCTHKYANQQVPIPDLPDWILHEPDEE